MYKDIKPRVDSRWSKKPENAVIQKPKATASSNQSVAITRPLSRQNSLKTNENVVRKEKTVKTITETITMQIKKTTTLATGIDLKKIAKPTLTVPSIPDRQFIRSPQSIKKKEKQQDAGLKFFESHSTHLIHQVVFSKHSFCFCLIFIFFC